jgi:GNAT superfamily N-acetyltransferase
MTDAPLSFRRARPDDVTDIVRMLADDPLGAQRERYETPLSETYMRAFRAIDGDTNNELIVACRDDKAVGVLQLTFIPYLTYQGGWRALIEGVRVDSRTRSQGLGKALIEWATRGLESVAASWSSSPRTRPAPTPSASMKASASSPRTKA